MSAEPTKTWTPETYLEFERESETRHEYLNGEIFDMVGASRNHNLIVANVIASLHPQLRGRNCEIYPTDMRVKVSKSGLYTYPDISVVCGDSDLEDQHGDTLLNPTLLIEVLSPSTAHYDRGKKFQHYRRIASLQAYVLIEQDAYRVEHYVRANDHWILTDTIGLDAMLDLPSIQCRMALTDIYEKVVFDDAPPVS